MCHLLGQHCRTNVNGYRGWCSSVAKSIEMQDQGCDVSICAQGAYLLLVTVHFRCVQIVRNKKIHRFL